MIRPRLSLARLLLLVVIVGLDCGLVRFFLSTGRGSEGLAAFGLALSLGVVGWFLAAGRLRRFSAGFTATGLLAAAAFLVALECLPRSFDAVYFSYIRAFAHLFPRSMTTPVAVKVSGRPEIGDLVPSIPMLLILEVAISLPVLSVALAGGLLSLAVRRRHPSALVPDPTPT